MKIFCNFFKNFSQIFCKIFWIFFENFFEKVSPPPKKNPGYAHVHRYNNFLKLGTQNFYLGCHSIRNLKLKSRVIKNTKRVNFNIWEHFSSTQLEIQSTKNFSTFYDLGPTLDLESGRDQLFCLWNPIWPKKNYHIRSSFEGELRKAEIVENSFLIKISINIFLNEQSQMSELKMAKLKSPNLTVPLVFQEN